MFMSLHTYRNHIDSPWLRVWLCLALVGDPSPALCPSSLDVEPSLWACLGPGLPCPGSPVPDPRGIASPEGPLSSLTPLPCCLALGPSLEETFCRKSRRLVTASQPRGPSSELRTETMVLAIPRLKSEMWTGEREGGSEGAEGRSEGETVLRQRGRRK